MSCCRTINTIGNSAADLGLITFYKASVNDVLAINKIRLVKLINLLAVGADTERKR